MIHFIVIGTYLKLAVSRKMEVAWGTGKNLQFSLSQSVTKCSLFPCYLLAQVLGAGWPCLPCLCDKKTEAELEMDFLMTKKEGDSTLTSSIYRPSQRISKYILPDL